MSLTLLITQDDDLDIGYECRKFSNDGPTSSGPTSSGLISSLRSLLWTERCAPAMATEEACPPIVGAEKGCDSSLRPEQGVTQDNSSDDDDSGVHSR